MKINEINKAKNLYLEEKKSLNEIGKILGYHPYTIKLNLQKNGVKIRTKAEQNFYTNTRRKKGVDDSYFNKIDSVNKAWLLGFLAADGTINSKRNLIKIGLSSIDREILEKIKTELKIERDIRDSETEKGFLISEISWSSKEQKDSLKRYGVVPKKTYLDLSLPDFNSKEKKLAFILGYFDGDGSISIGKNFTSLRLRICAHKPKILKDFARFFEDEYGASYSLSKDSKREMYELSVSTRYCVKIFQDMYNLNSLKLDRKYQKYLEYINHETETSDSLS